MIDLTAETVISLTEATKRLPARREGKRPHVATLYRWASDGYKGFRLETIRVGSTLCTSLEALQRFCERLTTDDVVPRARTTRYPKRTRKPKPIAALPGA